MIDTCQFVICSHMLCSQICCIQSGEGIQCDCICLILRQSASQSQFHLLCSNHVFLFLLLLVARVSFPLCSLCHSQCFIRISLCCGSFIVKRYSTDLQLQFRARQQFILLCLFRFDLYKFPDRYLLFGEQFGYYIFNRLILQVTYVYTG